MARGNYDFKDQKILDQVVYKLAIYWKKCSEKYKKTPISTYYGYFKKPDKGLKKLEEDFEKKKEDVYKAYIYTAPFSKNQTPFKQLK